MLAMTGLEANVTPDSEVAPLKALAPKLFTPAGITMAPRVVQDSKADAPMLTISTPVESCKRRRLAFSWMRLVLPSYILVMETLV